MIASPGDVSQEREAVTEQIHRWNAANASTRQLVLLPVKWETHSTPQMGESPQAILNCQILDDADIVIGIFGTRIGTPTDEYASGTVEEIKRHVAAGKTTKLYFLDVSAAQCELDPVQYAAVTRFREECKSTGLYATYQNIQQFKTDFSHHLDIELNQPRYIWLKTPESMVMRSQLILSEDAQRLLRGAANNGGEVIFQEGYGLKIGDEEFTDDTHRSVARWRAAMEELVNSGAVENPGESIFRVTAIGYGISDKVGKSTESVEKPFDNSQKLHARNVLQSLDYMQRDLLRFLLLQGAPLAVMSFTKPI
jgi:hypothetical protein